MRLSFLIAGLALAVLTACEGGLPRPGAAGDGPAPAAAPGAVEAIEVTSLDGPEAPAAPTATAGTPVPAPVTATVAGPDDPRPAPRPNPESAPSASAAAPEPATAPEVAGATPAAAPKSPAQIACERRRGTWAVAGTSGARTCVMPTRDGGKQCDRQTDCEGLCLARSGTCAPIAPLFGCNDILQADGRRVTLCLD